MTGRVWYSACELGLTGYMLENLLYEKYAVNMELADDKNVLAIVTYANEREDMDRDGGCVCRTAAPASMVQWIWLLQKNQEYPPVSNLRSRF